MYSDFSWKDAPLSSGSVPVITGALILDTDPFDFKFSQSDRHSVGSDPDFAMVSKYFLRRLNVVPLRNAANCVIFEVYQIDWFAWQAKVCYCSCTPFRLSTWEKPNLFCLAGAEVVRLRYAIQHGGSSINVLEW